MAIDQETFNTRLYSLLKTRGYKPVPRNVNNERTNPQEAEVFEFTFKKDGEDYGLAWVTIDQARNLKVYYNDEQTSSPKGKTSGLPYDDSWSGFLRHLKQWAQSKQLSFELQDGDRPGDDMRQRDTNRKKEKMAESYYAVNKTTSYSDNIPNVKVVIQHDRAVQEGEQRWRNVHKIFVENTEGERFAVPTRMPGIARVYGRHVAEGGTPYDDRGKHITSLVEEFTKMAGFVRATRTGQFNESVAQLIAEGINHHQALKESLQKMQSHRGYNAYFESWTPPLMEDDSDSSSIAEMFTQGAIDPRIESVLPILNRLNSGIINEFEEINELEQWARGITEITEAAEKAGDTCSCCDSKIDEAGKCGCDSSCSHCGGQHNVSESLEEDSGCACGCGPKSKCTCDASCPKCDCGKDKLEETEEQINEVASDYGHIQNEFDSLINDLEKRYGDHTSAFEAALETHVATHKKTISRLKNIASPEKVYAIEMIERLQDYLDDNFTNNGNKSGSSGRTGRGGDALSAADYKATQILGKEKDRDRANKPSERGVSAIGRAIAGLAGLAEERTDEFMRSDFDDDKPPRPKKGRLVTKDGQEVRLPYETVDFRGDKIVITGYQAPHKYGSTGRIYTDDGMEYFPGVADLKIIDHDFDDNNLSEGKVKDVLIDAQQMSREEFDAKYNGEWDYDEIMAEYPAEEEEEEDNTKYGIIRYPDTAISYIKNDGNGWVHIYDRSYGFEGKVDKEDLKYAKSISKEKMPSRLHEAENSPDGNVGADDDGDNDKYNQDAETVADRKGLDESDELLAIIRSIKF